MTEFQLKFPSTQKIVFDWTPPLRDPARVRDSDDIADRYIVVSDPDAANGFIIYALYHGVWQPNPWSTRALVGELLRQRQLEKTRFWDAVAFTEGLNENELSPMQGRRFCYEVAKQLGLEK